MLDSRSARQLAEALDVAAQRARVLALALERGEPADEPLARMRDALQVVGMVRQEHARELYRRQR
jgi:hypothetical protein